MIKHFIKTLIIFTGMIALGLLGIYLVNYFDDSEVIPETIEVAK